MHWSLSLILRYILFKYFLWFISLYSFQDSNKTNSNYFYTSFILSTFFFCIFIHLCCILNIFFCFIFLVTNSVFCFYSIYCHICLLKFFILIIAFFHFRCYLILFKVYDFLCFFHFQWNFLSLWLTFITH